MIASKYNITCVCVQTKNQQQQYAVTCKNLDEHATEDRKAQDLRQNFDT